jgi:aminoglycoside phosphotransferase (APT) family kinase protein
VTEPERGSDEQGRLPDPIACWIEQITGARLVRSERQPGGGRREAWLIDVEGATGVIRPLFLRYDRSDPAEVGELFTLNREARFYAALQGSDVRVPDLIGAHPGEQAILTARVEGETWFSRLRDEDERTSVATDFMRRLAALHHVDIACLDLPDEPRASLRECVESDIDRWERMYRFGLSAEDPLIEFGLTWLKANIPDADCAPVIVQGDTGPGNFLYQDGRVTAVLDWELAHLGDPMADLGWLALRAVQEPFTVFRDRLADYERFSGIEVDLVRLRYYRLFAEFEVAIILFRRGMTLDLLGAVGNAFIYDTMHLRLFADALREQYGLGPVSTIEFEAEPSEREWLYDTVLAQLRDIIVPGTDDPFVVLRAKGLARITKYLREADRYAVDAQALELLSLRTALGHDLASVRAGRAELVTALREGKISDVAMLAYISDRAAIETRLMRPAMGSLADRQFDPLT